MILFPFFGIFTQFHKQVTAGEMTFDVEALIAFFCYTVILLLIAEIVIIGTNILQTDKQARETIEENHLVSPDEVERKVE